MIRDAAQLGNQTIQDIKAEKARQIDKWGIQDRPIADWLAILGEEVGECNRAYLEMMFDKNYDNYDGHYQELIDELIQVATVAANVADALRLTKVRKKDMFQALKDIITDAWTGPKN